MEDIEYFFLAAFVVRFLTRRFIGSYSSSVCCAYPHTVSLDNALWPIVVSVLKYLFSI